MVLNENECSDALYNANHRELHVSTLMGFWYVIKTDNNDMFVYTVQF